VFHAYFDLPYYAVLVREQNIKPSEH